MQESNILKNLFVFFPSLPFALLLIFMLFEIRPSKGFSFDFKELLRFKELFYFFTWRDIKVKYKQTVLGFAWVILQPLILMTIFTMFFGKVLNHNLPPGINYPVFALTGLLFWNLFSTGITNAGASMILNANIIKKIYFPRIIIPVSAVLVSAFDFLITLVLFGAMLVYYGISPSVFILWMFPAAFLLTLSATTGLGLLLSALTVKYRDFRYIVPFFVQIMLFLTPVIYADSVVKNEWSRLLMKLNPMTGPVHLARCGITGLEADPSILLFCVITNVILLFFGFFVFRKTESYFADIA
jgi:lipopolysaccharide transport system permease protein